MLYGELFTLTSPQYYDMFISGISMTV